jgi:phage terminase large subunit-like protein
LIESLISLTPSKRLQAIQSLTDKEAEALLYDWQTWARPNQLPPPGEWLTWLIMAGRGFGKTRAGAEFIIDEVKAGHAGRVHLVAKTPADARDVMIEGESGILTISPPWFRPLYEPSKRSLTWPNGAKALIFSSAEPDQLRGPQAELAWGDEIRTWKYPTETWDNLMLGLRLGKTPRCVATTTPSPISLIKNIVAEPTTVITRGSTYDNRANLAANFFTMITGKYEGTTLGRQELHAELIDEMPGALWLRAMFQYGPPPVLSRIVVAIDPAVTSNKDSDETGIIVAGSTGQGVDRRYWVLSDGSGRMSPDTWAREAVAQYKRFAANKIIGEVNNGGDLVKTVILTVSPDIPYKAVHASHGKRARAEPIAALYEQKKVTHARQFNDLEDQLVTWTAESDESPDRMDALCWALAELSGSTPLLMA